jgi:hypothetical protein
MKRFAALLTATIIAAHTQAQTVTTLNETFNASCATTGNNYPLWWTEWNTIPPVNALAWTCTPAGGRDATPGIVCNSYIGGVHYKDTAWLFTPRLNLTGYTDSVYLRFDSRYDISGGKMQVVYSPVYDTNAYNPNDSIYMNTWVDLSVAERISPVIGPDDSAGWVTHYVNLTPCKASPLYVAFRYVSTTTSGGAWTIDNVILTPWGLNVADVKKHAMRLSIAGGSSTSHISFSGDYPNAGNYNAYLYDCQGREVHKMTFFTTAGLSTQSMNDLSLTPGIYFLKVGDINTYSTTSTIIQ